ARVACCRFTLTHLRAGPILQGGVLNKTGRRCFAMVPLTVPDFFQEKTAEALCCQVDWLTHETGVDDSFFARIIGTDETTVADWPRLKADLPPDGEETLRALWRTVLHLLSFLNFDRERLRDLFQHTMPARPSGEKTPLTPPWGGSSLKAYLEQAGVGA